jgi:hypothetical protein
MSESFRQTMCLYYLGLLRHNKPLDFSNQESEALHTNRDFENGFSSNVDNSGFQNEEGGFFVDIAEEGSFNNDQVCSV